MNNSATKTSSKTNVEKNQEWKNREVGALWKKKNEKGSYCTGYVTIDELGQKTKRRVIMFANKQKNKDSSPDFIIYFSNEDNGDKKTPAAKPDNDDIPEDLS